jgi:hypothetical protein
MITSSQFPFQHQRDILRRTSTLQPTVKMAHVNAFVVEISSEGTLVQPPPIDARTRKTLTGARIPKYAGRHAITCVCDM